MDDTIKLVITLVLSSGFIEFIKFLITRRDNKKAKIEDQTAAIEDLKKSQTEAIEELRKAILTQAESTAEVQKYAIAIGEVVVGLGQDKLIFLTGKYQKRNAITIKEKAILKSIYIPYHDKLGGNGYGKIGYDYCMEELDVISDEEAKVLDLAGKSYKRE